MKETTTSRRSQIRDRRISGGVLLLMGLIIAAVSVDIIRVDESAIHVPRWVLFLIAIVFGSSGGLAIAGQNSRTGDVLAAVIFFAMAVIGGWVSLLGSPDRVSGGLALLPREVNVGIARVLFGLGAMLNGAMCIYALRRSIRDEA